MIRLLLISLTLLHLGPGLAFALLAFGCEGVQPWLGHLCGQGGFKPFINLTLMSWLLLGLAWGALLSMQRARRAAPGSGMALRWRAVSLALLFCIALLLGAGVKEIFSTDLGYVSLPVLLAAGWFALANPVACQPQTACEEQKSEASS